MLVATVVIAAVTVLCFAFAETRWMGVAGSALLVFLHPYLLVVLVLVAVAAAALFHFKRRRPYRALPSPDARRD